MSGQKALEVVCVGAGYFSQFHYEAWSRIDSVSIVGICNRNQDKAEAFAEKYSIGVAGSDLREVLLKTKPDLVDVITPPHTHVAAVKVAAELGIDVICQKPFGENLQQAEEMVAIADKAKIKLIIHENFRFMPWYRQIKSVLHSGDLGKVLNVDFKLRPGDGQGSDAYLARQPYFQDMPKFLVHETAIHLIDTFRFLLGEPETLYAQLRRCNPVIKGEDSGLIVFEFPNAVQAVFDGNRLLDHCATNTRRTMGELEIAGTKAELRLDGEARLWLRRFGSQNREQIEYDWNDNHFGGDCVYETIRHIVEHYQCNMPLENQGRDYLSNIRIEEAIYRSAEMGSRLTLSS